MRDIYLVLPQNLQNCLPSMDIYLSDSKCRVTTKRHQILIYLYIDILHTFSFIVRWHLLEANILPSSVPLSLTF